MAVFLAGIQDLFVHQHIKRARRYLENQTPSLLDLIFTNEENMVDELYYLPTR